MLVKFLFHLSVALHYFSCLDQRGQIAGGNLDKFERILHRRAAARAAIQFTLAWNCEDPEETKVESRERVETMYDLVRKIAAGGPSSLLMCGRDQSQRHKNIVLNGIALLSAPHLFCVPFANPSKQTPCELPFKQFSKTLQCLPFIACGLRSRFFTDTTIITTPGMQKCDGNLVEKTTELLTEAKVDWTNLPFHPLVPEGSDAIDARLRMKIAHDYLQRVGIPGCDEIFVRAAPKARESKKRKGHNQKGENKVKKGQTKRRKTVRAKPPADPSEAIFDDPFCVELEKNGSLSTSLRIGTKFEDNVGDDAGTLTRASVRSVLEVLPVDFQILLDLGCGRGHVLGYARKFFGDLELQKARKKSKRKRFVGIELDPNAKEQFTTALQASRLSVDEKNSVVFILADIFRIRSLPAEMEGQIIYTYLVNMPRTIALSCHILSLALKAKVGVLVLNERGGDFPDCSRDWCQQRRVAKFSDLVLVEAALFGNSKRETDGVYSCSAMDELAVIEERLKPDSKQVTISMVKVEAGNDHQEGLGDDEEVTDFAAVFVFERTFNFEVAETNLQNYANNSARYKGLVEYQHFRHVCSHSFNCMPWEDSALYTNTKEWSRFFHSEMKRTCTSSHPSLVSGFRGELLPQTDLCSWEQSAAGGTLAWVANPAAPSAGQQDRPARRARSRKPAGNQTPGMAMATEDQLKEVIGPQTQDSEEESQDLDPEHIGNTSESEHEDLEPLETSQVSETD